MSKSLSDTAYTQLAALEPSLTTALRKDAVTAGWPAAMAKQLTVKITKSDISISYPDAISEQIEDLEYGSRTASPLPIMRKFIDKHTPEVAEMLTNASVDYLIEEGLIP